MNREISAKDMQVLLGVAAALLIGYLLWAAYAQSGKDHARGYSEGLAWGVEMARAEATAEEEGASRAFVEGRCDKFLDDKQASGLAPAQGQSWWAGWLEGARHGLKVGRGH